MLMGKRIRVSRIYLLKYPNPFWIDPRRLRNFDNLKLSDKNTIDLIYIYIYIYIYYEKACQHQPGK